MARALVEITAQATPTQFFTRTANQPGARLLRKCIPASPSRTFFPLEQLSRKAHSRVRAMAGEPFPTKFAEPIRSYDAHIYFFQDNKKNSDSARALRETIIEKFPHLEVYKFWEKPIGPHPTGMFEVDMRTPAQFAEFVPWIQVHHGVHSVLIHPHTGDDLGDHVHRGLWLGQKMPLITSVLEKEHTPES